MLNSSFFPTLAHISLKSNLIDCKSATLLRKDYGALWGWNVYLPAEVILPSHYQIVACRPGCCPAHSPTVLGSEMTRDPQKAGMFLQLQKRKKTSNKMSFKDSHPVVLNRTQPMVAECVCTGVISSCTKTNLCGYCLSLLTGHRRCGSFFLQDSVEPHGSWKGTNITRNCWKYRKSEHISFRRTKGLPFPANLVVEGQREQWVLWLDMKLHTVHFQ